MSLSKIELLEECFELVKNVKGNFAEFGVFRGDTFKVILKHAIDQNKLTYAFDSFIGMAKPTKYDYNSKGRCNYPTGKFNQNGVGAFKSIVGKSDKYIIVEGFIPETLKRVPNLHLSLARIDLDHYQPTVDVLEWAWEHLNKGGILHCDDYLEQLDILATKAIKEFVKKYSIKPKIKSPEIYWIKE